MSELTLVPLTKFEEHMVMCCDSDEATPTLCDRSLVRSSNANYQKAGGGVTRQKQVSSGDLFYGKFLHAPIFDFGNIQRASTIERHIMRKIKFARRFAVTAQRTDHLTIHI